MIVSYDVFTEAFLSKITEYNFVWMSEETRQSTTDGYLKRACAKFSEVCKYDIAHGDNEMRTFDLVDEHGEDISEFELDEIVDIVSEGMVLQWFKQHQYKQENLENALSTVDYTLHSPAEMLKRSTEAYNNCKRDFRSMVREYSFRHGDLTVLHI